MFHDTLDIEQLKNQIIQYYSNEQKTKVIFKKKNTLNNKIYGKEKEASDTVSNEAI